MLALVNPEVRIQKTAAVQIANLGFATAYDGQIAIGWHDGAWSFEWCLSKGQTSIALLIVAIQA